MSLSKFENLSEHARLVHSKMLSGTVNSIDTLCHRTELDKNTVSAMLTHLRRAGFVASPDGPGKVENRGFFKFPVNCPLSPPQGDFVGKHKPVGNDFKLDDVSSLASKIALIKKLSAEVEQDAIRLSALEVAVKNLGL